MMISFSGMKLNTHISIPMPIITNLIFILINIDRMCQYF